MTWESVTGKQRKYEIKSLVLFAAYIVCGLTGDWMVRHDRYLVFVGGMEGISLVILQIQGTIDTLSIAVLSLLGGRISETYMGMPLIDFILNRKPVCLKQKWIINSLIFLLCFNIFLHLLGLYNTVLALFLVTAGLIVISIKEIYEVFSGDIVIENEIKSYLIHSAENGTHREHLDLTKKFCNEWELKIGIQIEPEYEIYRQIFDVLFKKLFQDETPNSRQELQKFIYPAIRALLCAEAPSARRRGLSLLREIYQNAWACIRESKDKAPDKALKFSDGFHLFHAVCYHLREVVKSLPIAETEKELKWFTTVEYIFLVNYWIAVKDDENAKVAKDAEDRGELWDAACFTGTLGCYLAKSQTQEWHAESWEKPFGWLRLPICPPDKVEEIEQRWSEVLFYYAVSLVNNNMLDLLENSLYIRGMTYLRIPAEEWKVRLILEIHCYIYYLTEYETSAHISEDVQKSCKDFLWSHKIRRIFSRFLRQISCARGIFNPDLEKHLYNRLMGFEFLRSAEEPDRPSLETIVQNFVVFIALYLYGEYDPDHMMEQVFSDEFVKFHLTEYIKSPGEAIKRLDTFLQMLSITEKINEKQTQERALKQYAMLEQMTKDRLKVILMKEASNHLPEGEQMSLEGLEQQIEEYINEKFALVQSEDAKSAPEHRIRCFSLDTVADMPAEEYLSNYFGDIADGMLYGLCKYLFDAGSLQKIDRKNFQDDTAYIAYIRNSNAGIILGSRQIFLAKQYSDQKVLEQYLDGKKVLFAGYHNIGMLLKENSLQIHVEKVSISVRPLLVNESGARYDPEHDEYTYNTSGTELKYKREELADYLKQSRRMIRVAIRLSIRKTRGVIGDIVYADWFPF